MLISGSADKQLKIWNLNFRPSHVIATHAFDSNILQAGFSKSNVVQKTGIAYKCFGITR